MNQSDKAVLIVKSKNDDHSEAEAAVEAKKARSIEFCNETSKSLFDHDFSQREPQEVEVREMSNKLNHLQFYAMKEDQDTQSIMDRFVKTSSSSEFRERSFVSLNDILTKVHVPDANEPQIESYIMIDKRANR